MALPAKRPARLSGQGGAPGRAAAPEGAGAAQGGNRPGPYTQISAGMWHTCALTTANTVDCWGDYRFGQTDDQPGPFGPYEPGMMARLFLPIVFK